ncbi:hypothetical protein M979_1900 [Buttiauxella noackiae ATCC 51607]|uniref:Lysozyme inhibitor LprI N-terminal domain-containing protein n=1 Tax=Buttiauxella noackiae ATCC 51607 TaxID=1354255 RepID=A0A1B7HR00_9ENTR|nr:hypothetical protein [Buttiauxella noackiae]OAT18071.1 hypothetical protein M979_1900 [Buttiauxella noackiae ATCC 51607]
MIINKKVAVFFLVFVPFLSVAKSIDKYSDSYSKCAYDIKNHPVATDCISAELLKQEYMINEIILKNKDITSPEDGEIIDLKSFVDSQKKSVNDKCSLWRKTGGQNGILLENQCVLDETISIKNFLNNFISSIEG